MTFMVISFGTSFSPFVWFYRNEDKLSDQTDFLPNTAEKLKLQRLAGEFLRLAP